MYEELFSLFMSARDLYIKEVVENHMKPSCFIEMYCDSRKYIDCRKVRCRNVHQMNLGIVRRIFTNNSSPNDAMLLKTDFGEEDFRQILDNLLIESIPPSKEEPSLSFGCNFSEEQMTRITALADKCHLFCVYDTDELQKSLVSLFECKNGFRMEVNNIRMVAIFFDAFLCNNMICYGWQKIIASGGFLISHKTGQPISASSLSSALCKARAHKSPIGNYIQAVIRRISGQKTDER